MMKTARKKREWFPTTGDRVLRSIPRSDNFPGKPWAREDSLLWPDVYEGKWSTIDWTRAENFLRIRCAAYVNTSTAEGRFRIRYVFQRTN